MTERLLRLVLIALMLCIVVSVHHRATADSATQPPKGPETQSVAAGAPIIDIANYELVKEIVKDNPDDKEWKNTLAFRNSDIRVPLEGSGKCNMGESGLNPKTLNVQWIVLGRIIWIRWYTIALGSGSYCSEAHILLLVENGKATELTRQGFFASGGTGLRGCFRQSASFEADNRVPGMPQILRRVSHYYEYGDNREASPMAIKNDAAAGSWIIAYHFLEEARFLLQDGRLVDSPRGLYSLRLDLSAPLDIDHPETPFRAEVPIEEVAEFLVPYVAPRYGHGPGDGKCTPPERDLMIRDLRKRNLLNDKIKALHGMIEVPYSGPPVFVPLKPTDDYYPFDKSSGAQ